MLLLLLTELFYVKYYSRIPIKFPLISVYMQVILHLGAVLVYPYALNYDPNTDQLVLMSEFVITGNISSRIIWLLLI